MEEEYNGILVVNKPSMLTSRDVVNKVSKVLHTKKIGHTGTLDPIATGVLILIIGKCTKLSEILTTSYKTYTVTFKLGYETDTLDYTGKVLSESSVIKNNEEIIDVISSYVKTYMQEVPAYSAVKINGKKLYEYARNGIDIKLPKREVTIKSISDIVICNDTVKFTCEVSKGTYIRSLVRDIGRDLGTYATMTELVRISQNGININEAYTLEEIENNNYKILGVDKILSNYKKIECDSIKYKNIINGVKQKESIDDDYIVYIYQNKYIALYKKDNDIYRMYVKL